MASAFSEVHAGARSSQGRVGGRLWLVLFQGQQVVSGNNQVKTLDTGHLSRLRTLILDCIVRTEYIRLSACLLYIGPDCCGDWRKGTASK